MAERTFSSLRAMAEAILCQATGATRVVRLCPTCGSSAHGQPRLVGSTLTASISYADGLVAVAWGAGPIGVDIERATPGSAHRADRAHRAHRADRADRAHSAHSAHSAHRADLEAWTRLEALAKAAGTGLRDWPRIDSQTLPDVPTRRLELPAGYVGSLAGEADVRLAGPAAPSS